MEFDISDLFKDFFGDSMSSSSNMRHRGADVRYDIDITLEEAYSGVSKNVNLKIHDVCVSCSGTGSAGSKSDFKTLFYLQWSRSYCF